MARRRTVLSLEQALSLPYATLRFAQLGWRVIRVEATPSGDVLPGDPNRYIGARVADDDRRSYFVAPNVGKESIALNLKDPRGREALRHIVRELDVDVFCCNTLPGRYEAMGIDHASLSTDKPDLIWAGISAMGPGYPNTPGYDPILQAMAGYMELTGDPAGPPTLMGVPLVDLKAGDELYAGVLLALAERAETGRGTRIDVSMLQAAASWLITVLPLIDFGAAPTEMGRSGNEHRKFVPTNAYPARDGFIYMAIGNDVQWKRLTEIPKFAALASDARRTNEGRNRDRQAIQADMASVTRDHSVAELTADFTAATIPHAPINTVPQVAALPALAARLTTTTTPDGRTIRMQPKAVDHPDTPTHLPFPPKYGAHTRAVLAEAGYSDAAWDELKAAGVVAA